MYLIEGKRDIIPIPRINKAKLIVELKGLLKIFFKLNLKMFTIQWNF